MRRLQYLAWILAGLCAGPGWVSLAHADEVFICDGNKVVRVALENLEALKQTNPCVAAHYGLTITPERGAAKSNSSKARVNALLSGPTLVKRPTSSNAKPSKAPKSAPKQTGHVGKPVNSVKRTEKMPSAQPTSADTGLKVYQADEALPVEDVTAKPSDYRNIRVLNAKSNPAKWYRHVY